MLNPTRVITYCTPAIERFYVVGLDAVCALLKQGGLFDRIFPLPQFSSNQSPPVDTCTAEGTALKSQLHGAANAYARVSARMECDLRAGVHANAALFCLGRRRSRSRRHGVNSCTDRHLSSRPANTRFLVVVEPESTKRGSAEQTYFIRLHFRVARHFCF